MSSPKRPVLISSSQQTGGAARATFRLHQALRASGVPSSLLVREGGTDAGVVHVGGAAPGLRAVLARRVERAVGSLQRGGTATPRSFNVLPTRISGHPTVANADVVNLHWVGKGAMSVGDVGRLTGPRVLTLHDMWAFAGAEHLPSQGPEGRWQEGYSRANRPPGMQGLDLDRWTWIRKRRAWEPVHVVAPSNWLAGCAGRSALMASWPIEVIPNALDTSVYRPIDRRMARSVLGLDANRPLILLTLLEPSDPNKGADLFSAAMRRLSSADAPDILVVGAAEPAAFSPPLGPRVRWYGVAQDDVTLALLYSAADVAVVPSRIEAQGQVATEALACGTPVVAFRTSGLVDVVEDGVTGFLASPFSTSELADAVQRVLADPALRRRMGARAAERARELWSYAVVQRAYVETYGKVIEAHQRARALGGGR